jgi:hypothetical protein
MSIFSYICFPIFVYLIKNFLDVNFLDLNCTVQARGRLMRQSAYIQYSALLAELKKKLPKNSKLYNLLKSCSNK